MLAISHDNVHDYGIGILIAGIISVILSFPFGLIAVMMYQDMFIKPENYLLFSTNPNAYFYFAAGTVIIVVGIAIMVLFLKKAMKSIGLIIAGIGVLCIYFSMIHSTVFNWDGIVLNQKLIPWENVESVTQIVEDGTSLRLEIVTKDDVIIFKTNNDWNKDGSRVRTYIVEQGIPFEFEDISK
ncbi:hypothetical protein [Mangrovibacillus cuniculi]|uniref:Uncharacterized protein n=1 Tax=Mangrovibacillus cuniculi TaxID=2593652 RepID=A0A7S8HFJ6_9BACI|nr:hypothetical protein [Mangrovibacillus cuniculi]QPC46505.1 hypothetical protein G8O30_05755 [Mangrovibacillus cuniculi]